MNLFKMQAFFLFCYPRLIDNHCKQPYNESMKKILLLICMVLLCAIVLGGCGVKSDLARDEGYPRNYPVY